MGVPARQETHQKRPRLLTVSRSAPLLIGRNDLLATAGYSVVSPKLPADALVLLEQGEYVAVLIGHTVYENEGEQIAQRAKDLGLPAIFVYEGEARSPEWADLAVDTSAQIDTLLNFLDQRAYHGTGE